MIDLSDSCSIMYRENGLTWNIMNDLYDPASNDGRLRDPRVLIDLPNFKLLLFNTLVFDYYCMDAQDIAYGRSHLCYFFFPPGIGDFTFWTHYNARITLRYNEESGEIEASYDTSQMCDPITPSDTAPEHDYSKDTEPMPGRLPWQPEITDDEFEDFIARIGELIAEPTDAETA